MIDIQICKWFSINLIAVSGLIIMLSIRAACAEGPAAQTNENPDYDWIQLAWSDYAKLQYYERYYSPEVYAFCRELHSGEVKHVGKCVKEQQGKRNKILRLAKNQLGDQYLAQALYDECLEYYPIYGVNRVSQCVGTRLQLRKKVGSIAIEELIYRKCDDKWRKHGIQAIHNCCMHEGRYYRERGELRDW